MPVKRLIGLALVLAIAGLAVYMAPAFPLLSRFAAWPAAPKGPVTFLIAGVGHHYVGYHTRGTLEQDFERGLTDKMIVVQLNPEQKAIKLLDVPRDTKVGRGFTANDKINAAIAQGGPDNMVRTVESFLGVQLDGYALVSIDGTRELVDAVGGVDLNVPIRMKYTDNAAKLFIDLRPGKQHLNGKQVEGYLRFRYDNLGDIGRVKRQQEFYDALAAKLREPATILKLPDIARVIDRYTRTDLTREHVGATLGFLMQRPRVDKYLLPGDFGYLYGVSYWVPDSAQIRTLVSDNLMTKTQANARDVRALSIAVANATSIRGLARSARGSLQTQGFRNVWVSNSTSGDPDVTLVQSRTSLQEAQNVAQALGIGQPVVSKEGVPGAEITIRVGRDYRP